MLPPQALSEAFAAQSAAVHLKMDEAQPLLGRFCNICRRFAIGEALMYGVVKCFLGCVTLDWRVYRAAVGFVAATWQIGSFPTQLDLSNLRQHHLV